MLGILGALTLGFGVVDNAQTNKKAKHQAIESLETISRRNEIFKALEEKKGKDYAPHLKKAVPEWKKGRLI